MIDTHVHFNVTPLYENIDEHIFEAESVGVNTFLVIGFDHETIEKAIDLAERYPKIYIAVGYHPTIAHTLTDADYEKLATYLEHPKVRALGEFGLDSHWNKETLDVQEESAHRQIKMAKERDLPVIIHMRDAAEAMLKVVRAHAPLKGVMHCYSGPLEMMQDYLDCGLHIGLDGPVTFKNAKTPKAVAEKVPIDRLVIETDAPYLAPHPYRGQLNTSAYLPLIVDEIAKLRKISKTDLMAHTTRNAEILFNIKE
jgi:TatD DNase family protein